MTYPRPRPFAQPTFRPLSPQIVKELDAWQQAEIEQAWVERQTGIPSSFPLVIVVGEEGWKQLTELLEQPPALAPQLTAALARPRRFKWIGE